MLTLAPSTCRTPLVITARGHVALSDVKAIMPVIAQHRCECGVLWDMRQSELSELHCRDIKEVVECISSVLPKECAYPVAIIGSNMLHFGLFRAFQTYVEFAGLKRDYAYFTDFTDANGWVEMQLARKSSWAPEPAPR